MKGDGVAVAKNNNGITHSELCMATAKRFVKTIALVEYDGQVCVEKPDVLLFLDGKSFLFEIKVSLEDFRADRYKEARKKYRVPHWAKELGRFVDSKAYFNYVQHWEEEEKKKAENRKSRFPKAEFKFMRDRPVVELVESEHLGNRRYFVCPKGVIPVEKVPEGWGLYWYENGRFYLKKVSEKFRSNLKHENMFLQHAMRRLASGNTKNIVITTYAYEDRG